MASSSFEEECKRYFGSSCLYAVLGLEKSKNLTAKQVRQAYYNAVLAHHPDRCEGISKSEATEKFQLVSKAFAVLGNDEKRDMYFRTGRVDENDFCEEKCWIKYWRCFYKEVADSMLKPFAVVYRGSNEEALDVKKAYVKYKGDMNCIMESLIMSEIEDEPRYRRIINGLIEAGEVELYDDYANEPAEKATARREKWARECKELQKRCAVDNPGTNFTSLPELFNARQREFDSGIFDVLLEKYRQTEQRKEVSERPTSSKAKWKSVDQPKLVKQESEKGVKIEASEVKRDSKRSTKKRRPYKASKEKERSRPEEDEQKNYARTIIRTRYRERITRQELEEQRNLQLRNKEKVTVQNNGLNGAGEHTERKREKRDNKRRKKSENKEDTPANRQTRSRAVRKSRKMGQKRVAKRKKESTDRQRSSRKTELQNGNYESQDEGKKMKLTISKKRGTKNARTSIQPTCSTSTSRKKRGQSMRITDEDVNDRSKHSSKFEKASGSKVNAGSRRSKRKRRRSRRWQT